MVGKNVPKSSRFLPNFHSWSWLFLYLISPEKKESNKKNPFFLAENLRVMLLEFRFMCLMQAVSMRVI